MYLGLSQSMKSKPKAIPEFKTKRLLIRGVQLKDAESYEKSFNTYQVIKHLSSNVPWPYSKGGVKRFLAEDILPSQGQTEWLWVLLKNDEQDKIIGSVHLSREGRPEQRGFWLAKEYWGRGLMTEALIPITDYAFDKLRFKKLVLSNAVGNNRSRRIKEKMGAIYIETFPAQFVSPNYTKAEKWELTKDNWRKYREKEKIFDK